MVSESFASERTPISPLQARAIVAGMRRVAYRALRKGEPESLRAEVPALATMGAGISRRRQGAGGAGADARLESRDSAGGSRRRASGRGASSRGASGSCERWRQLAAEEGYGALSIPAISARAGTSNATYYENFDSKEEAFLAAFDELAERAMERAAAAFAAQEDWGDGVAAGLAALLSYISSEPIFARLAFFELPASGVAGLERSDRAVDAFTAVLRPRAFAAEPARRLPEVVLQAIGGGLWASIQHEIEHGRARTLPGLAPQLAALVLAPWEGEPSGPTTVDL